MDPTIISYISLLTSLISIGMSVYVMAKVDNPSPKKEEQKIPPKVISTPVPNPIVEVPPQSEPVVTQTTTEHPPIKRLVVNSCAKGQKGNEWYLEATGAEGTKFSIQVEWSDGTSDVVFHGVTPVEIEFIQPKGIIPVKVVGIPPYGDNGVSYLWELNGFHWS